MVSDDEMVTSVPEIAEMVCVDCAARALMGRPRADRSGWDLWLGGGRCPACVEKKDAATPVPPPSNYPQVSAAGPREIFVECAGCGRTFESLEYADGHRPTIHWLTTEENKPAKIGRRSRCARG